MSEFEKYVITASESRVQDLYRKTILTCPVNPYETKISFLRGGIDFPATTKADDVGSYMRECDEKGIIPFSRMEINSHSGEVSIPRIGVADWTNTRFTTVDVDKLFPGNKAVDTIYIPFMQGKKAHRIDYNLVLTDEREKFKLLKQFERMFLPLHEGDSIKKGSMSFAEEWKGDYMPYGGGPFPGADICLGYKHEIHPKHGPIPSKIGGIEVVLKNAAAPHDVHWDNQNRKKLRSWAEKLQEKYSD